jgi:trigger factor
MTTTLSEHDRELIITVPPEVVAKEYSVALKKYQQKASRPGFRPGKMPEAMVKQLFGAEIKNQLLEKLIEQSFQNTCVEKNITPVSQAKTELLKDFDPAQELSYKAIFQAKPEVEVKNYEGLNIELKNITFNHDDINEELQSIRESQAFFISPEGRAEIGEFDVVECDSEVLIEGVLNSDYCHNDYSVPLFASNVPADLKAALVGKKIGDSASVMYTMPEDYQDEIIKGKQCEMRLRIKSFKERVLPELDDNFAKDLSEKFHSLAEVKESIELRLSITANRRRDYYNQNALIKALIDNNSFDVPSAMLDRATYSLIERQLQTMDKESAEKLAKEHFHELWQSLRPKALQKVQADLILEVLIKNFAISANEDEINYRVQNTKDLEAEDAKWMIEVEKALDAVKKLSHITIVEESLFPKGQENA